MMSESKPMKIGYVVKMFPRLSETFILNEMLELEWQGVEVTVFSLKKPNEGRFHPQVSSLKAKVYYLDDLDPKKWNKWLSEKWSILSEYRTGLWELMEEMLQSQNTGKVDYIWWSAWLAATAKEIGLNHLHAHFASIPSTVAYFAHRISRISYSFTAHAKDIYVYAPSENLLFEKLDTASFVVTVTHFNKRYMTGLSDQVDSDKIKVIHNGINLEYFESVDSSQREEALILGVGRLVPKKGFDRLIEACQLLKEENIRFQCVIVGDGMDREILTKQIADLGLMDQIELTGPKTLDDVADLMRRATVFCLPCTTGPDNNIDALPTVLLESLAVGLPAISTTISGIPEIISSGQEGYLIEPDDSASLCAAIKKLLASPSLRSEMAEKCRFKANDKFDLKKNVACLSELYRSVIESRSELSNDASMDAIREGVDGRN